MAKSKQIKIICSNCGAEVEFTVYDSINAKLDADLKDKLIDDTLYKVDCSCGAKLKEIYPLLYHDPDKKFVVYGAHPDSIYKIVQTFDIMKEKNPDAYNGYTLRAVSSPTALREKVIILNAGLDDRVIELYKFLDVTSINELHAEANATKAYFYIEDGKNMLEFNSTYYINKEITSTNYEFIKEAYAEEILASENSYIIDDVWAENVLLGDDYFEESTTLDDNLIEVIKEIYDEDDQDEIN